MEDFSLANISFVVAETSEETLARVLNAYEIGPKLRALRLRKKIGLTDLARHTGLSASMLSQLETGKLTPTLPTLARIAIVFDVGLDHFFTAQRPKRPFAIVRHDERIRFPERADLSRPSYFFECLAFAAQRKAFEVFLADFPVAAGAPAVPHQHDGAEFIHVLEGILVIHFEGEDRVLQPGDSAYFDSGAPHSYHADGATPARAIVVTSPPRA